MTVGPGLIGALLVGVSTAKAIAAPRRLPLIPVDHLQGHVAANFLEPEPLEPPFLCLVASGGHTMLAAVRDHAGHEVLGRTLDDAAGEAFDKVARLLGLGYPGGPAIERLAAGRRSRAFELPVAMTRDPGLDFSFSGLKTALVYLCRDLGPEGVAERRADLAASFQAAAVGQLAAKLERALKRGEWGAVALGGGVAANGPLREAVGELCEERGVEAGPARALHRQRGDDRLGRPPRRASPTPTTSATTPSPPARPRPPRDAGRPSTRGPAATSARRRSRRSSPSTPRATASSCTRSTSRATSCCCGGCWRRSRSSRWTASSSPSLASTQPPFGPGSILFQARMIEQAIEESDIGEGLIVDGERLSLGVAARLSRYLQVLTQARKMGRETISSQELSEYTHINPTQIRRDLSGFGKFGKRGVGYNVESLVAEIRKILRTSGQHNIALFGAGNLGQAIASSDIFADHGFRIVAMFDVDPGVVGSEVGGLPVRDFGELEAVVAEEEIVVGVLAVPADAAQEVADRLVEAGVKIIFNYSEQLLQVPPEVTVHTSSPAVDLLYALYFYLT